MFREVGDLKRSPGRSGSQALGAFIRRLVGSKRSDTTLQLFSEGRTAPCTDAHTRNQSDQPSKCLCAPAFKIYAGDDNAKTWVEEWLTMSVAPGFGDAAASSLYHLGIARRISTESEDMLSGVERMEIL